MEIEENADIPGLPPLHADTAHAQEPLKPKPVAEKPGEEKKFSESDVRKILIDAGRAITEEPVRFEIDVAPKNWLHKILQRWGRLPKKRPFEIRPLKLGNFIRVSTLLLEMDFDVTVLKSSKNLMQACYKLASEKGKNVAQVIAIAIHNRPELPDPELAEFILYSISNRELGDLLAIVFKQMDTLNFSTCMALINGLRVLEPSAKETLPAEVNPVPTMR